MTQWDQRSNELKLVSLLMVTYELLLLILTFEVGPKHSPDSSLSGSLAYWR